MPQGEKRKRKKKKKKEKEKIKEKSGMRLPWEHAHQNQGKDWDNKRHLDDRCRKWDGWDGSIITIDMA